MLTNTNIFKKVCLKCVIFTLHNLKNNLDKIKDIFIYYIYIYIYIYINIYIYIYIYIYI